ncbi:MAG: hypothetical protein FWJ59_04260 [Caldicoprobacter sp.]|jgi:hypothetical protein|uniref:hypothetical protein n=1 Tax=Caldicoprobacter sp. TaxID=2004500 RepID=UPI001DFB926D|nr:hypothetical protein [Clostridia bacterium]
MRYAYIADGSLLSGYENIKVFSMQLWADSTGKILRPYYKFIEGVIQTNRTMYEVADGRRTNCHQPPEQVKRVGF